MKKILLLLFSITCFYSAFAQGDIIVVGASGDECSSFNFNLSYDASLEVTSDGKTYYGYVDNPFFRIVFVPANNRWEYQYQYAPRDDSAISYSTDLTSPKPPATGWSPPLYTGCGSLTLSGDVAVLTLSPGTLPDASVGAAYSQTISASGGTAPYSYASGTLPPGLMLDTGTGELSGTPTTAGTYKFTLTASDASSEMYPYKGSKDYTVKVKKYQTISFLSSADKTYGDADFDPGATASSGLAVSYASGNTDVATIVGGKIHIVGAGTATITASQAGNDEWGAADDKTQELTVTKKALTVTATGQNKTYDGNTDATVILGDDRVSGDVLTAAYTAAAFDNKNAGTGKTVSVSGISLSGSDAGNYSLPVTTASTTADITAKTLTVTATGQDKTYDGSTDATVTLGDDRISGDVLSTSYTAAAFDNKDAGTGKTVSVSGISLSGSDAGNYSLPVTTASTTADITTKTLTVTVTGQNKTYDGNTEATVTLSDDRISGDVLSTSYTAAAFDNKNAGTGKAVSVSGISLSGSDAGNYSLPATTASTTAAITAKTLTVTATGQNKTYDGKTDATVTLGDDRISGDKLSTSYTATFDNKNAGTGKTVKVSGISLSGSDAGNYSLPATTTSTTADITTKTLTITVTGQNKTYDGKTDATVTLGDDRVSGDKLSTSYTATFDNKNAGTGKTVSVSGISLSGSDAGNYRLAITTASTTADITTKTLTVTATGQNKTYDGNTEATVTLSDDRISGDVLSAAYTAAAFDNKNAGTGKTVSVSGISLSGSDAGNYSLAATTASTKADIKAKTLTVTATGQDKVYDGSTDATVSLAISGDGPVAGDDVTVNYTSAGFGDKNTGTGKPVEITGISLGGNDAANYSVNAAASTTADITARALTVTAAADNKEYDGNTTATVTLSDNRVSGDNITTAYTAATFDNKDAGTGKTVNITGITIGGTDAGNYSVNAAASTTADITARALTVTAAADNKEYDGNTTATVTLGDNRVSGDNITTAYTAATFDSKDAGTGKTVSVSGISLSGSDAGNYSLPATTASTTAAIKAKTLTVTATGQDKVYDGSTDATVSLAISGDGSVIGDDVTVNYTSAGFGDKNTGTGKPVEITGISLGGNDAANYSVNTTASTTADITAKPLTVTATGQDKVYDGSTDATVSLAISGDGPVTGDDVTVNYTSAGFGDKNTGTGKPVEITGVSLGGSDAANYSVNAAASTTADITTRALTVTADAKSKTYGNTDPVLTYTATGFAAGDDKSILSGTLTREPGEDVDTYAIQLGNLSAGANYTINFVGADFTIGNKVLTVTADAGQSKIYGATDPTFTYTATGFENGDNESVLNGALSREAGEAVGTYAIQLGSLSAGANYTINYSGADFAITPATLDITVDAGQSKIYGATDPTFTYTATGFENGDNESVLNGALSREAGEAVGTYAIQLGSLSAGANYTINYSGADFAITPATLDITVDVGQSKIYGATDPTFTYTASGFANGDDESILSGALSREAGEAVGTYAIQLGNLSAGTNYTLTFTGADFTIGKKAITVTADAKSKTYGDTDPVLTYTATGFANGDDKSVLSGTLTRETGEDADTYAIQLGSLSAGTNYTLSFTGAEFTVDRKALTVTATGQDKVYDGSTDATVTLAISGDGPVTGDDVTVNYTSAGFGDKNVGTDKPVEITGVSLGGSDAANYSVNAAASTTADITVRTLTVTADAKSKTYGDADPALTYTATGFAAGDDKSVLSGTLSREPGEDAGTYAIQLGSLSAVTNYTLTFTGADFTITNNRILTVTADAKSKVYGNTDPELSYTATGFANGDDESILSGTLTREPGEDVDTYAIQLGNLSAGANYTINFVGADFTIGNKVLTVTADAGQSKIYGATDPTFTYTATGFENGDNESVLNGALSREAGEAVGTYAIQLGSLSAGANYTINYSGADFAITPATLDITVDVGQSKIYGATDPTFTYTASGFANGDDESILSGALSREAGEAVGTYAIQLDNLSAGTNYTLTFTGADFTIGKKAITVTADAKSKTYGDTDPELTYTATGFAAGDDKSVLSGTLTRETGEDADTYAIQLGSLSAGTNYTLSFTGAEFTVDRKALTVTATGQDKVYDGSTDATVSLAISGDGPVTGDDVTVNYTSAGFGDKNTGTGKPVEITGVSLGGSDAANYSVNAAASATADITTRALTVTAAADNKEYDGNTTATVTLGDNRVSGDNITTAYTAATFDSKDAGTGKTVNITGITIGGTDAGNYSVNAAASTTADITARTLTVTAAADNKEYDGNTTATVTLGDNRVSGDNITTAYTAATFDSKDAGTGKTVNITGITIGGTDAGNYSVNAAASTTADITARTLTVTAAADNKEYDGNTTATVTLSDNRVSGDNITTAYTAATFDSKDAGTGKTVNITGITVGGTDAGNYSANAAASTTADITVRTLTVTADAKSKTYGDTDPALTYTATGFATGDDKSVLSGTLTRVTGEDAGTYAIQLGSLSAGANYTINFVGADFTIGNKVLTVTADAGQSKIYGATDPVFTYTATGFANGDDKSVLSGSLSREPGEDADTYAIGQGSLSAGTNYTLTFTGADFTITNNRILTVTADAKSKTYGAADPELTYTVSGFANGDDESVLSGTLTREPGEDAGTYAIGPGSLSAGTNYTLSFTGAEFTVDRKALTVTATGQDKVYDGSTDATVTLAISGDGPVTGDDVTVNYTSAGFGDKNVGTDKPVEITGISLEGNDAANYSANAAASTTADITVRTLTVTADAKSKTYGDTDPELTYTATGFAAGDDKSVLSGTLTRVTGEDAGTYAIQLGSLSAGTNYTLSFTGADFTITNNRILTVTADAKSKTYGAADPALTYTATGFASGDDGSVLSGSLTREAGEDADTYAIQLGSLSAGTNYTLSFTGAEFTVDRKALTVTATGQDKVYDGSTDATVTLAISGDGSVTGDDVTVNYTSAGFGDKNVGTDKPVEITGVSLGGSDAANYSVNAAASTTADITARTLTVTADAKSKTYGAADPELTYTITGFAAGDDKSVLSGTLTREPGEDAGTYAIQLGSLSGGTNYTLSFTGADFVISNKKVLTVTADAKSKVYGAADPVLTYTATGFANGDDKSVLSGTLSREAGEDAGTYAIQLGSLSAGTNYTLSFTGAEFTVERKALTVTATGQDKVYDGSTDATVSLAISGDGPVTGDDVTVNYTSAGFGDKNTGTGKPVEITGVSLGGSDAANYSVNAAASTTADITVRTLTVTADAKSKTYGAADPELTYTVTGFANGDDESILSGTLTRVTGEDAGTYAIQLGSLSGGTNYTLSFTGADFVISNKKVLTVTADAKSKTYGAADPVLTYTATGFANGDDKSVLSGTLTREAGEDAGTYAIQLGSLSAGTNYTLSFTGAEFTIIRNDETDTDGDGVPDEIEDAEGSDPGDPKNYLDTDGDNVPDYVENQNGTNPDDGSDYPDTDADRVPDYVEERDGTDPGDPQGFFDSDSDGVADYVQVRSIKEFVPQTLRVAWGTPVETVPYPGEVVAITSQDEFINMAVSWDLSGYDPVKPGSSSYPGTIKETGGLFNGYNRVPMLEISVQPKPAPENVTLGNSEFIGNPETFFQEIGAFTVVDPSDDIHEISLLAGEGDNRFFEVKSGILFWSSTDEAAGRTEFTVVVKVTDRTGNELVKPFAIRRLRTPLKDLELFNAFTPNGDGMNDTWGIPALRYYSGVRIQVFDNGGQRLFYTEDADTRWDGKYGGKELPVGAYFYVIEVRETGETRRGTLNLLTE